MKSPDLMNVNQMRLAAQSATSLLRVLANEDRLLLLCQMTQGERSVSELETALDLHQPSLSQQLGVLRNEGLVNTRRDGKRIFYSIADPKVMHLLESVHGVFCQNEVSEFDPARIKEDA